MSKTQLVQAALKDLGVHTLIVELDDSTRTAAQAAAALNVALGCIVKSLVFMADDAGLLALVAGDRRADLAKLEQILKSGQVSIASAVQVQQITGYAIGGVPPVGHKTKIKTLIDQSLSRFETLYAAAGGPKAVFPITFAQLVEITDGHVADLTA